MDLFFAALRPFKNNTFETITFAMHRQGGAVAYRRCRAFALLVGLYPPFPFPSSSRRLRVASALSCGVVRRRRAVSTSGNLRIASAIAAVLLALLLGALLLDISATITNRLLLPLLFLGAPGVR